MKCLYIVNGEIERYARWKKEDLLYGLLKEAIGEGKIDVMMKDLAHEDPAHILAGCVLDGEYDLVVGSGFAGVFALIVGRAMKCRTVLVNPLYPFKHYGPNEYPEYEYEDLLSSYEFDKLCWDAGRKSLDNVFVILGEDDDIVDTKCTDKYFRKGNAVYVSGGHEPAGDDFKVVFQELVRSASSSAEDIRKKLETFKATGEFQLEPEAEPQCEAEGDSDAGEVETTLLPGNNRLVISMGASFSVAGVEASNASEAGWQDDVEDFDDDEPDDEDKDDTDSGPDAVRVIDVSSQNGNFAIKWVIGESSPEYVLYLYYKDGVWYRDEEDGRKSKMSYLEEVMKRAADKFLQSTTMAEHDGSDYWGWVW